MLAMLTLGLLIASIPTYFAFLHVVCAGAVATCRNNGQLTPDDLQALQALGLSLDFYARYWVALYIVFTVGYAAIGAVIFWRKSDDRMALLASFSLVTLGAAFPSIPAALVDVNPAWWLPVTIVGNENVLGFPSLFIFFFLFPSGHFVPRWTRWVAIGFAAEFVLTGIFPGTLFSFPNWPGPLVGLVPVVAFGSLVVAQVYRYRRVSTLVERQQTKWIVFGTAVALLGYLLHAFLGLFIPLQSFSLPIRVIFVTSIYLVLLLIPLLFAFAILRYRLWDVDVLINKTLVYGLLTGILIAVYSVCILVLEALLQGLFKQTSEVAIVISTLVIAALFQPLRRRIQNINDRRFYQRKYDAARTLAAFTSTLRSEVDLNQISNDFVAVVQETMQPSHVSLWLRNTKPSVGRNTRLLPEIDEEMRRTDRNSVS